MVKKQLLVFWSAALVATLALAVVFLRVPEALGVNRYTITAEFSQGAGLYDGAQVNYRGAPVGKVTGMVLQDDGIRAEFTLKDDVTVPSDVRVEIRSMSAVGEQYVELVPADDSTGSLSDGDNIPVERTSFPVEIGPVLDNVDALVRSLPRRDLDTVLEETALALQDRDGDLQAILDGTAAFLGDAEEAFAPTKRLIEDADPLLAAVNGQDSHLTSLTRNLALVTDELRARDGDLRALLDQGPGFATETTDFLAEAEPVVPALLGPLSSISQLLATYKSHLGQVLSDYPVALSVVQSVNFPHLDTHQLQLTLANMNKPGECIRGFLPVSQWQSPLDPGVVDPKLVWCAEPANDPRAVRGARNIPCAENPWRRAATIWQCRGEDR
jgi:phospholipid/cholesterol/gamma-HCH transport system substrate-binding protein